ncbi:hypothetical protein OAK01_02185 [Candidatus Nitrosopelagicus sp.]|nr:hypothetical protein [Candidatus Nitrosopelagicus sp.]
MELRSESQNSFAIEEVSCVFCDRLLDDHSTDQLKQCMAKHLEVQNILQGAIGDGSSICETE